MPSMAVTSSKPPSSGAARPISLVCGARLRAVLTATGCARTTSKNSAVQPGQVGRPPTLG